MREENNLTLSDVSKHTGISSPTLSRYEKGIRNPKIENWEKLADFFGVSVSYLKGESDYKLDIAKMIEDDENFNPFKALAYGTDKNNNLIIDKDVGIKEFSIASQNSTKRIFSRIVKAFLTPSWDTAPNDIKKYNKIISKIGEIDKISDINTILREFFYMLLDAYDGDKLANNYLSVIVNLIESKNGLDTFSSHPTWGYKLRNFFEDDLPENTENFVKINKARFPTETPPDKMEDNEVEKDISSKLFPNPDFSSITPINDKRNFYYEKNISKKNDKE